MMRSQVEREPAGSPVGGQFTSRGRAANDGVSLWVSGEVPAQDVRVGDVVDVSELARDHGADSPLFDASQALVLGVEDDKATASLCLAVLG